MLPGDSCLPSWVAPSVDSGACMVASGMRGGADRQTRCGGNGMGHRGSRRRKLLANSFSTAPLLMLTLALFLLHLLAHKNAKI